MPIHPSQETLQRAIRAFRHGHPREALALAEAAHRMVEEIPGNPPHAGLAASWRSYLRALVDDELLEGLEGVRAAATIAFWEPRVFSHLAQLELRVGSRRRALDAVRRGLVLAPEDRELLAIRAELGVRQDPPLRFLSRTHPVNRMLGAWRAKGRTHEAATPAR